jgi:chromosome segregation ATPase
MFGYVAQTPESLRLKDGKAQIEEFKKVIGASLDETEIKLKKDFEEVSKSRTEANRSYTGIKKKLEETPMYVNWEEFEKLYSQEKSIESEKSKYLQAQEKSSKYQEAQLRLSSLQEQKTSKAKEIQDLENKLITLKNEQAALDEKIEVGEKYINDNSSVISEFEEISKSYLEISQYIADRNNWLGVVTSKKEMEEYESLIQAFDSQKDTIKAKLRELYTSMLPNIEGLEIISVEELDSDKKVGVYYKDKPISILSESELWGLYLQIWDALNIKFVIIDNISDLGSRAVEIINQMAAEGVYFFAAKMKRNEPMTITITEKVDD